MAENEYHERRKIGESAKFLEKVDSAAYERLKSNECNLDIGLPNVAYTTTIVYLEELSRQLKEEVEATGRPIAVSLGSLMTISIDNRESDTGEKAGNLVPTVELGEMFKLGIKNDASTEE